MDEEKVVSVSLPIELDLKLEKLWKKLGFK